MSLQANIFAELHVLSNVTITKVTPGSINVANSVAFTGRDSDSAAAGSAAYANLMTSDDGIMAIYGTTFGTVTVSDIKLTNTTNPSEFLCIVQSHAMSCTSFHAIIASNAQHHMLLICIAGIYS